MTTEPATSLSPDETMLASYAAGCALDFSLLASRGSLHERHRAVVEDLAAAHRTQPIDFEKLHCARAADFRHGLTGIIGKIDRETGELPKRFKVKCARNPS